MREAEPREPRGLEDARDGFLLTVGRLNARKNLATTLEAAVASGVVSVNRPLVVVGERQGRVADLPASTAAAIDSGAVRFPGFVDDDELAWLYQNADALLFVTLGEGFGLPTLEALHFGAPVIASDIPVFREILNGRATLVPPTDREAIAEAIRRIPPRGEPVDTRELGYSWPESVRRMRAAIVEP